VAAMGDREQTQFEFRLGSAVLAPATRVGYSSVVRFHLPARIEPGRNFAIGLCSGVNVAHNGGPELPNQRLEHYGSVAMAGASATAIARLQAPSREGLQVSSTRNVAISFRYEPETSRPPITYEYRSEIRGAGDNPASGPVAGRYKMRIRLQPEAEPALLGTGDILPAMKELRVDLTVWVHMPDGQGQFSANNISGLSRRTWTAIYQQLAPGQQAASFADAGGLSTDACPAPPVPPPAALVSQAKPPVPTLPAAPLQPPPTPRQAQPQPPPQPQPRPAQAGVDASNPVTPATPGPGPGGLTPLDDGGFGVNPARRPPPATPAAPLRGTVPNVRGKAAGDARREIEQAGLIVKPEIGRPAPTPELANLVDSQDPPPGQALTPGAEVRITLFDAPLPAVTRRVPQAFTQPPPPVRQIACPELGNSWRREQVQAVRAPLMGGVSGADCVYQDTNPATRREPVLLELRWIERGYQANFSCTAGVKASLSLVTPIPARRPPTATGIPILQLESLNPWMTEQLRRPAEPQLVAQIANFAEPCGTQVPARICDDDPRCAFQCPATAEYKPANPAPTVPIFLHQEGGISFFRSFCAYDGGAEFGRLSVRIEHDLDGGPHLNYACGDGQVTATARQVAGSLFESGFVKSTTRRLLAIGEGYGLRPNPTRQDAIKRLLMEVLRAVEPRVAKACGGN